MKTWEGSQPETYHGAVAQQCASRAPCVCDEIDRGDIMGLEVPERAPSRMSVDLQRVVGCAVEEEDEGR